LQNAARKPAIASYPGEVAILLAVTWYENWNTIYDLRNTPSLINAFYPLNAPGVV